VRVCGIDLGNPGGLAILTDEERGRPWTVAWHGWARMGRMELLRLVYDLCRQHQVEIVATERPFTGRGDRRPRVGLAQRDKQGIVRAACEALQVRVVEYAPQTIKLAVAGHGRADKSRVGRCVKLLVAGLDTDHEHVLDAGAVALLALSRERHRRLLASDRRPRPLSRRSRK
jgi:Holliday junction resolvasome RuvABC endonuclease subunit